jgi:hypothetical protein
MPDDLRHAAVATRHEPRHGESTRNMTLASLRALSGHGDPGKFGRMFPTLPPSRRATTSSSNSRRRCATPTRPHPRATTPPSRAASPISASSSTTT